MSQEWRLAAACRNHPEPDLFFSRFATDVAQAIELCCSCPVRRECLTDALQTETTVGTTVAIRTGNSTFTPKALWGVRGGLLPGDRYRLITGKEPSRTTLDLTAPIFRKPRRDRFEAEAS